MHGSSEVRFARGGEHSHPSGVGLGSLVRTTYAKARTGVSSPVAACLSAFAALMRAVRVAGAVGVMMMGYSASAQTTGSPDGTVSGQSAACGCLPNGGCPNVIPTPNSFCVCWCLTTYNGGATSPPDAGPPIAPPGPATSERILKKRGDPDWPYEGPLCNGEELLLSMKVGRYLGPTVDRGYGDGVLADYDRLIASGIIGDKVKITLAVRAYKRSGASNNCSRPRVEYATLNGQTIHPYEFSSNARTGMGNEGKWEKIEFLVPIRLVLFPGQRGNVPWYVVPRTNYLRIKLSDSDCWCVEVDWSTLEYKAMSPVIFVHGIGGDRETFRTFSMADKLDDMGVLCDTSIFQLPRNAAISDDGEKLASALPTIARWVFGSDKFHIVAHSKGGLDSRIYLDRVLSESTDSTIQPVSLTTIATPHHGSPVADLIQSQHHAVAGGYEYFYADDSNLKFLGNTMSKVGNALNLRIAGSAGGGLRLTTYPRGVADLTTNAIDRESPTNTQTLYSMQKRMQFAALGACADRNGNSLIDDADECEGFGGEFVEKSNVLLHAAVHGFFSQLSGTTATPPLATPPVPEFWPVLDNLYRLVGSYSRVTLKRQIETDDSGREVRTGFIVGVRRPNGFECNDIVVSKSSALGYQSVSLPGGGFMLPGAYGTVSLGRSWYYTGTDGRDHSRMLDDVMAERDLWPILKEADKKFGGLKE
jgi:hypothetical protein